MTVRAHPGACEANSLMHLPPCQHTPACFCVCFCVCVLLCVRAGPCWTSPPWSSRPPVLCCTAHAACLWAVALLRRPKWRSRCVRVCVYVRVCACIHVCACAYVRVLLCVCVCVWQVCVYLPFYRMHARSVRVLAKASGLFKHSPIGLM